MISLRAQFNRWRTLALVRCFLNEWRRLGNPYRVHKHKCCGKGGFQTPVLCWRPHHVSVGPRDRKRSSRTEKMRYPTFEKKLSSTEIKLLINNVPVSGARFSKPPTS